MMCPLTHTDASRKISKNIRHETPDIETSSESYALRFSGKLGKYFLDVQEKITLDLLKQDRITSILDIGGGHAQLAVPLAEKGFKVTVTGSHPSCAKRLGKHIAAGSLEYLTSNILDIPFDDRSFDAVIAFRLMAHVNQWQKLLSEMCRVSKKVVLIDYPERRSVNFFSGMLFSVKKAIEKNTRQFKLFSRKMIVEELFTYGFGNPLSKPQFLLPMSLHRALNSAAWTATIENIFRLTGITHIWGSPVILKTIRLSSLIKTI